MGQTFVYNSGKSEHKVDELHLNYGLFFDGTLNSKENTRIREAVENQTAKSWEIALYKKHGGTAADNVSFQNDYTNVARMQMECKKNYAIYIEGIGTVGIPSDIESQDKKQQKKTIKGLGDVTAGYAMGGGVTGIRGKVCKGCEQLAELIKDRKRKNTKNKILKTITLDVFGFSRGAAAARNFVYEINSTNKREKDLAVKKSKKVSNYITVSYGMDLQAKVYEDILIDKDEEEVEASFLENGKMPRFGYLGYMLLKNGTLTKEDLKNIQINIRFIGVYDTVSSYEEVKDSTLKLYLTAGEHLIKNQFQNDVEQLQLNNLGRFEKAVHFTAMDEHRENFDLTRMYITNPVSMPNSLEFNLPGVHCDVGGAYLTAIENVKQIETGSYATDKQLRQRVEKLISEYWYNKEQLKINNKPVESFTDSLIANNISGSRFIHKEYSYIPLHFMETFFRNILCEKSNEVFARSLEKKFALIVTQLEFEFTPKNTATTNTISSLKERTKVVKKEDKTLIHAKDRLQKYVFGDYPEWEFISDDEIAKQKKEQALQVEQYNKKNGIEEENTFDFTKLNFNPLEWNLTQENQETKVDSNEIENTIDLEEIVLPPYNEQLVLRTLRNRFLHWSATRKGFGMDPRNNYRRVEH